MDHMYFAGPNLLEDLNYLVDCTLGPWGSKSIHHSHLGPEVYMLYLLGTFWIPRDILADIPSEIT